MKAIVAVGALLVVTGGTLLATTVLGNRMKIVLDGEFAPDSTIEYTNESIQFPMAHIENSMGQIVSYDVNYEVVNVEDKSSVEDEYAYFDLKTGDYKIIYTYAEKKSVSKEIPFCVQDTTAPVIEFSNIPNGLFLQDLSEEDAKAQKLPLYDIEDASTGDGIDLKRTLYFKGESDEDFVETTYREINGSYEVKEFGKYKYELTATDVYGNSTTEAAEWKIKDRNWKPSEPLVSGYLADYASEGYTNYIEGGDANQYYMIGSDYKDEWLAEYEGAEGVFKIDMGFNNAAGYGNNTVKLHFANSFTQKDIEGKYLAVRIRVEGENLKEDFLFGGNNVEFRTEDATTRAFTASGGELKFGEWKTYYIDATTVQSIGMYPNGRYNPNTTFYEGGDPATCLQLCFARKAGYFNDMTLYIDSISLAEKLPETEITISGKTASWTAVKGAAGYLVNLNGEKSVVTDTKISLPGAKGYIRVTPLGDGALTLDGEEVTAVYGLDAGNKLAAFDDELYVDLFSDNLKFSTEAEHKGYQPKSYTATYTGDGVTLELETGNWGIVTGIKVQFPQAKAKGNNTTLVMNMNVSHAKYGQIRVYDFDGQLLTSIPLSDENVGKYHKFEVDLAGYDKALKGVQLIFGPKDLTNSPDGVTVQFKEIYYANTYYDITVNGKTLSCAGEKKLIPGYTQKDLVQFTTFYNFGVSADDTPLSFEGTVLLDGKKLGKSAFSVVGYKNTDTICFKLPHEGKVLTIMKESIIYYGDRAVKVGETFNAKWNGSEWVAVANIPATPEDEYVTVNGEKKLVANKTALTPAYTQKELVQFSNVNDFGVTADDTPLGFDGIVMLDGVKVSNVNFVGYLNNTTICLKVPHDGKLLTILKDSIIYYDDQAVIVTETFNMKWDGSKWLAVSNVPEVPNDEYVTVDGDEKLVVNKTALTPGYTQADLVQFTNVNDYGVGANDTPLGFEGTILLEGVEVEEPLVVGYLGNTTICFKVPHNGKVLTVMKDSIIYYGNEAVIVTETFNAKWNGSSWEAVAEIPTPPQKEYVDTKTGQKEVVGRVVLTPGFTLDPLVQFLNVYDFGVDAENTPLVFEGLVLKNGTPITPVNVVGYPKNTTICFNVAHNKEVLTIMAGSVIYHGDKAVVISATFNQQWNGCTWEMVAEIPMPEKPEITATLTPDYTTSTFVQFTNFYDFGVPANNTALTFNGTVKLDGDEVTDVQFIGYANNTTICLNNISHQGKVLTIEAGSTISYGDTTVKISETFEMVWDGSAWGEAPEVLPALTFTYSYGTSKLIQVKTDLPSDTPCVNFLASENGCNIDQSGNQYQQFGWAGMTKGDDNGIYIAFIFGNDFSTGQTYVLPKGAVFGFTDGKTYELDKDYTFTFDGSGWSMAAVDPDNVPTVSFNYSYGTNNLIQVKTDLPSDTPCVNFLAGDNGCNIDQSGNRYQQFGWAGMDKGGDNCIYIAFNFGNDFSAGQTYVLPKGAVFGFTDGKTYELDKDYTFTFDGSSWMQQ